MEILRSGGGTSVFISSNFYTYGRTGEMYTDGHIWNIWVQYEFITPISVSRPGATPASVSPEGNLGLIFSFCMCDSYSYSDSCCHYNWTALWREAATPAIFCFSFEERTKLCWLKFRSTTTSGHVPSAFSLDVPSGSFYLNSFNLLSHSSFLGSPSSGFRKGQRSNCAEQRWKERVRRRSQNCGDHGRSGALRIS